MFSSGLSPTDTVTWDVKGLPKCGKDTQEAAELDLQSCDISSFPERVNHVQRWHSFRKTMQHLLVCFGSFMTVWGMIHVVS